MTAPAPLIVGHRGAAAMLAARASQLCEGDFARIRAAGITPLIPWPGAGDPSRTRRLVEDQRGRAAASRPPTVPAQGAP